MKELGSGRYLPTVYDFFPRTARGHGAQARYAMLCDATSKAYAGPRSNNLCVVPQCELVSKTGRGDRHKNQEQNRKDWEESVGIRGVSKATRSAASSQTHAAMHRQDPKDLIKS